MKIEYVSHACLLIETSDVRIATDPWWDGAAYCGQWHVFPRPVRESVVHDADVILLSHGHEDHLHAPTLTSLPNKGARVFFPYLWHGGATDYLTELGFKGVTEAVSGKTHRLSPTTTVTYLVNSQDSIIVVESDGEVLVNVNDALHSFEPDVIDLFTREVRRRWPRIDVVFCGFGGASYYPNTIHVADKDDREIARVREQLFAHNFCRIVERLKPKVAVPFAADFVLLAPEQRWVNEVRFPRDRMAEYFAEHFGTDVEIHDMYPGDRLDKGEFVASSPYREQMRDGALDHLIEEQYREETSRTPAIREETGLGDAITKSLVTRAADFSSERLDGLRYTIRVSDLAGDACFNIRFEGKTPTVTRSATADPEAVVVMTSNIDRLTYCVGSTWGGDVLIIGYGFEIAVADRKFIEDGSCTVAIELLVHHLKPKQEAKRHFLRMSRYLASTWFASKEKLLRRLRGSEPIDAIDSEGTVKADFWLSASAEEIRRRLHLPPLPG